MYVKTNSNCVNSFKNILNTNFFITNNFNDERCL